MIACGGPDHCGTVGVSPPKVVLSILWMRTRRRATVSSFGSDWSSGWTWMMNAEVTAENRPACKPSQHIIDMRDINPHKYQRGVQVFVISFGELPVIFLGLVTVQLVELGSIILLGLRRVLFLTARGVNVQRLFEYVRKS